MNKNKRRAVGAAVAAGAGMAMGALPGPAAAWEPTKTVEFIVPAGTGGGADQMARMIQGVVQKHQLMAQPIVVINKSGGAGAEGFLDVKADQGNAHKIIITLSNLFTTPLATGVPFSWEDLTPVAMLALDEFVLWVNADEPYQTPQEYLDAAKEAGPGGSRWAARAPSRRTRSSPSPCRRRRAPSSPTCPSRAAAMWRSSWSAATSTRASTTRSSRCRPLARRRHAPALRVRQRAPRLHGQDDRHDGVERHPDLQGVRAGRRVPDAARHLHAGRRRAGAVSTSTSTCSRRCARRPSGRTS